MMTGRLVIVSVAAVVGFAVRACGIQGIDEASDVLGPESDAVALLQVGAATKSTSCSCLNWAEVYSKMPCGRVFELNPYETIPFDPRKGLVLSDESDTYKMLYESKGYEFCDYFMKKMNNTLAVSFKWMTTLDEKGAPQDRSWCYTDASCEDLKGGTRVKNSPFSFKFTRPGVDIAVSDLEPEDMERLARLSDIDFGMFVATAGYIKELGTSFEKADPALVEKARSSGKTVIFTNVPDHGHRVVVKGQRTWRQHEALVHSWHLALLEPPAATGTGSAIAHAIADWSPAHAPTSLLASASTRSESCSCLNWKHVYSQMQCGLVFELSPYSWLPFDPSKGLVLKSDTDVFRKLYEANGPEFCSYFMKKMNNNYAVSTKWMISLDEKNKVYDRSWCYTDASCQDLKGGSRVQNSSFSFKFTRPGVDLAISDLEPEEMERVARESNVDFGMFVATAGYVQELGKPFEQADPALVEKARSSGKTVIFTNVPDHDHRVVVKGQKTWRQQEVSSNMTQSWHLTLM